MAANKKLLILPGDGIGPEVMGQVRRVIDWMAKHRSLSFDHDEGLVGGAAIDAAAVTVSADNTQKQMADDALLLGTCGGAECDVVPFTNKPVLDHPHRRTRVER